MLCLVIPEFDELGRLPPGIHFATWEELHKRFGVTLWRRQLLEGLREALLSLKAAGCSIAYLDGSFVTEKEIPGDFDACWGEVNVDPNLLDPVLLDFKDKRAAQKQKFKGELFPASFIADEFGNSFLSFFQKDRDSGDPKGIIAIDLARWQP